MGVPLIAIRKMPVQGLIVPGTPCSEANARSEASCPKRLDVAVKACPRASYSRTYWIRDSNESQLGGLVTETNRRHPTQCLLRGLIPEIETRS